MELAEVVGRLDVLRRFPVEPLAGETPNEMAVGQEGAVGDRHYELVDGRDGSALTPRSAPALLAYSARFLEDFVAEELEASIRVSAPDGRDYGLRDSGWLAEVSRLLARPVSLRTRPAESAGQGVLGLLSRPTLRFVERVYGGPLESQWLRANFLVELSEAKAFAENEWAGRRIRIGDTLCEVIGASQGCLAAGYRPEAPAGDMTMLDGLLTVRGGSLGVSLRAVSGRRVRVADPVSLVED